MNRLIFLSSKRRKPKNNKNLIDIQYDVDDIDQYLSCQYNLNNIFQFHECCHKIIQLSQQQSKSTIIQSQMFENFIQNCIELVEQIIQYEQIENNEKTFSLLIEVIRETIIYHQDIFINLITQLLNVLELSVGIYSSTKLDIASELISFVDKLLSYNHIYQECIETEFERKILFQALHTIQSVIQYQTQQQNILTNDNIDDHGIQNIEYFQHPNQIKIISTCCKVISVISSSYSFINKYFSLCDKYMIQSLELVIQTIINNYYQDQNYGHNVNGYNLSQNNMKLNIPHDQAIDLLSFVAKITSIILDNGTTNSLLQFDYYSLFIIISQNALEYVNVLSPLINMILKLRDYFVFKEQEICQIYFDNYIEKYFIYFNLTAGQTVPTVYASVLKLLIQVIKDQNENEVLDDMISKPQYLKMISHSIMSNHQLIARCSIDVFLTFFDKFTLNETAPNDVINYIDKLCNANLLVMLHNKMRQIGQQNLENEQMFHILHLLTDIYEYNPQLIIDNEFVETLIILVDNYADQKCVDLAQDLLNKVEEQFPQYQVWVQNY